jgi:hypothetical protein
MTPSPEPKSFDTLMDFPVYSFQMQTKSLGKGPDLKGAE